MHLYYNLMVSIFTTDTYLKQMNLLKMAFISESKDLFRNLITYMWAIYTSYEISLATDFKKSY